MQEFSFQALQWYELSEHLLVQTVVGDGDDVYFSCFKGNNVCSCVCVCASECVVHSEIMLYCFASRFLCL